jgi:hypothetical protein
MKNTKRLAVFFLAMLVIPVLPGCSLMKRQDSLIHIRSIQGGTMDMLPETRSPVLLVNSSKGIGRANLQLLKPMPEGMVIEFPGLKQLELFSLKKNGKALICHGAAEPELPCTWGNEWPVARMTRHPGGMTVVIPARIVSDPGEWLLEWVDYYRK